MSEKTMGQVAFEAYCKAVGGVAYDGKPIPGWWELSGDTKTVQGGWEAAADAVQIETAAQQARLNEAPRTGGRAQPIGDFRDGQQTRWRPIAPGMWQAPVWEPEPLPPVGQGVLDDYRETAPVPVEVGPDDEAPVECDHPGCTIAHDRD